MKNQKLVGKKKGKMSKKKRRGKKKTGRQY